MLGLLTEGVVLRRLGRREGLRDGIAEGVRRVGVLGRIDGVTGME